MSAFACQPPRQPTYSSAPSVMPSPANPGAGASVSKTLGTSFCRASSIGFELGQESTSTTFQSSLQGGSLRDPTCICPPGGIEQQQGGTVAFEDTPGGHPTHKTSAFGYAEVNTAASARSQAQSAHFGGSPEKWPETVAGGLSRQGG